MNYHWYIKHSPDWTRIRARELIRAWFCCEFCGQQGTAKKGERWPYAGLHVHHLTYDNLGNEPSCDLIVLCADCHADVHEFPNIAAGVSRFAASRGGQSGIFK